MLTSVFKLLSLTSDYFQHRFFLRALGGCLPHAASEKLLWLMGSLAILFHPEAPSLDRRRGAPSGGADPDLGVDTTAEGESV